MILPVIDAVDRGDDASRRAADMARARLARRAAQGAKAAASGFLTRGLNLLQKISAASSLAALIRRS
jgi:hypothetical protein